MHITATKTYTSTPELASQKYFFKRTLSFPAHLHIFLYFVQYRSTYSTGHVLNFLPPQCRRVQRTYICYSRLVIYSFRREAKVSGNIVMQIIIVRYSNLSPLYVLVLTPQYWHTWPDRGDSPYSYPYVRCSWETPACILK